MYGLLPGYSYQGFEGFFFYKVAKIGINVVSYGLLPGYSYQGFEGLFSKSGKKEVVQSQKVLFYLPDMYSNLRFALYPKPHWYSGKMTSIRQIIQDFQE